MPFTVHHILVVHTSAIRCAICFFFPGGFWTPCVSCTVHVIGTKVRTQGHFARQLLDLH